MSNLQKLIALVGVVVLLVTSIMLPPVHHPSLYRDALWGLISVPVEVNWFGYSMMLSLVALAFILAVWTAGRYTNRGK